MILSSAVCILPLERSVGVAQFILFYCATNFYMRGHRYSASENHYPETTGQHS